MNSGIYRITCLANLKIYIGSTSNFERRFKTHKTTLRNNKHRNPHLQSSFNKYGEAAFNYEIVEFCDESSLKAVEQLWIDKTECYLREIGFNNCRLSDRPLGYKHTEASKKIMSAKKKGVKQSLNAIAERAKSLKGLVRTEETRKKMSEAKRGDKNPRYGTKYTEEEKIIKVERLLSVPRWNVGKTKENDPLMAKIAEKLKGRVPVNRVKCKLVNLLSNEQWQADSLLELSKKCPLSLPSINRLKKGSLGSKSILVNYRLEVVNDS